MKRTVILLLSVVALLAGCQAAEPAPTPMPDVVGVTVTTKDIHYDLQTIEVQAGDVLVITLINEGALTHDLVIDELPMAAAAHVHEMDEAGSEHDHAADETAADSEPNHGGDGTPALHVAAMPGTISTATLTPTEPGRYTYYCTVAGHREAGMEGVLVVTAP